MLVPLVDQLSFSHVREGGQVLIAETQRELEEVVLVFSGLNGVTDPNGLVLGRPGYLKGPTELQRKRAGAEARHQSIAEPSAARAEPILDK